MEAAESPLLRVLRATPRRFRMPALPADAQAARAAGVDTALAFALEAVRTGGSTDAALRDLFTGALAALVRQALAPGGDAGYQAQVLRSADADVEAYAQLSAGAAADRRAVRSATDAVAHPGKLRAFDAAPREALAQLHRLAARQDWEALARTAAALPAAGEDVRAALRAVAAHPALARLRQRDALRGRPAVQRYLALCAQRGPRAGSEEAAARGRASARAGDAAEHLVAHALSQAVQWLDRQEASRPHRLVRGLRAPAGFPAGAHKAKDEWDAAIVRRRGDAHDIVLLVEVKASPAAATPDFGRLLRGLQRLAHAEPAARYTFASATGPVDLHGSSLQALQPAGFALPAHVVYCCAADETRAPVLSAASNAVLLGEPASLAFARAHAQAAEPSEASLRPVWDALADAARLRATLHQYDTARAARAAMLHPQDLLAALAAEGCTPPAHPPAAP